MAERNGGKAEGRNGGRTERNSTKIFWKKKKKLGAPKSIVQYARTTHNFYFWKKRRGKTCSYVIDVLLNIVQYAHTTHNFYLAKKNAKQNLLSSMCSTNQRRAHYRNQYCRQTERQTNRQTDIQSYVFINRKVQYCNGNIVILYVWYTTYTLLK